MVLKDLVMLVFIQKSRFNPDIKLTMRDVYNIIRKNRKKIGNILKDMSDEGILIRNIEKVKSRKVWVYKLNSDVFDDIFEFFIKYKEVR